MKQECKYKVIEVYTTINNTQHRGRTIYKIYDFVKDQLGFASYKTKERAEEICSSKNENGSVAEVRRKLGS